MKKYSVSIKSLDFVNYYKAYVKIVRYWRECGGTQENGIFIGDENAVSCFHLTFNDNNLIITFSEIKAVKV
jgi:hypothetical protein